MDAVILAAPSLVGLIAVALLFDFLNGLHDAANSIATIVSTRVLRPRYAVMWAAFFNFIAFLFFGLHVAQTLGTGIIDASIVDPAVIFARPHGRYCLERRHLACWAYPSSSSHALIGGLVGAGIAKAGSTAVVWTGLAKTTAAIVLSPLTGFVLALLLVLVVSWIFVRRTPYRGRQHFPHPAVRLRLPLLARPWRQRCPEDDGHHRRPACSRRAIWAVNSMCPFWVVLSCQAAMALGTLFGGWRIVHTMGSRITRLTPHAGLLRRNRRRDHPLRGDRTSAFRSRPPTPSPAPSWASAPPGEQAPYDGASRAISSSPGF